MPERIRAACVQLTAGTDKAANLEQAERLVARAAATGADLVVLPDEPYAFSATDGPEAFPGLDVAVVSGRHLTWYGPSLVAARDLLERQLAAARPAGG